MASRGVLALGVVALTACDAPMPESGIDDPQHVRAALGISPQCPEPVVFAPDVISVPGTEEYRVTFTPDGATAYFATGAEFFPFSRKATIMESHLTPSGWSTPQVASFSGQYGDIDPFVSPDGSRLFFSSIRPVGGVARTDADLWMVEKTATGWSAPIHLGDAVNSPTDDLYPSVTAAGTLYFGSDRAGGHGGWDLYHADAESGSYGAAVNLGPNVNSDVWEFNPWVSPGGALMIFTSIGRADGFGFGDLYGAIRIAGSWSSPVNLGPCINTADDEYHATLDIETKSLYFVRHSYDPWIDGDLYQFPPPSAD